MANLGFSLRSALGLIPKTEKIESEKQALKEEFNKLNSFIESNELKEYIELKAIINSDDFKNNKKKIIGLNFKTTEEYQKELRFSKLKKNKNIINYFQVLASTQLAEFNETEQSDDLKDYIELRDYLDSQKHKQLVHEFADNLNNEKNKYKEFKVLEKSKAVKEYYSTLNSSNLKNYNELVDSAELNEYMKLKDFCASQNLQEFKKAVAEQLASEKNKTKELKSLKNNASVKAYIKNKEKETIEKPSELVQLEELETYVNSEEYRNKLKELEYKNTEEYKKEEKFKTLQKNKKFTTYFKFIQSSQFNRYEAFKSSNDLKYYEDLKAYIASSDHQKALTDYTYTNSDEYKKEQKFGELKKSQRIMFWGKYQKAKPYLMFKEIEDSELLKEYQELEDFIGSETFKELKNYMLDKQKWQKTEEYQQEIRFNELDKSPDIKWYFAIKDSSKFDELKAWNLTFEDDFTLGKVDEEKWMNSYFWGKMLLKDRYVIAGDKHFYSDNKNIELNGTTLKIVTKKEKTKGKVWHPVHGFTTQEFDYTSGMLTTAHSYRQLYGKIEAKIKLNAEYPIYQAFWLKGEKILPEVDVFKFNMDKRNRFQMSSIWGDASNSKAAKRKTEKINGSNFAKDYFIYTLDWTEQKLTWKINGIEVYSVTEGIPNEPLYLLLSAGIQQTPAQEFVPAAFEIDWVRCYEKA